MANEINCSVKLDVRKSGAAVSHSLNFRGTMAGEDMLQTTQLIGTSAETITLGEITGAPSKILIQNLDATNFVEIGGDSGLTVFKLKLLAGEALLLQPSAATIYAKADTASCRILIIACEA